MKERKYNTSRDWANQTDRSGMLMDLLMHLCEKFNFTTRVKQSEDDDEPGNYYVGTEDRIEIDEWLQGLCRPQFTWWQILVGWFIFGVGGFALGIAFTVTLANVQ
jgi:hypothetical protein